VELASKVHKLFDMPGKVRALAAIIGIGLGLLLLIPEIVFWIQSCFRPTPDESSSSPASSPVA